MSLKLTRFSICARATRFVGNVNELLDGAFDLVVESLDDGEEEVIEEEDLVLGVGDDVHHVVE
jgi:hypothetical protein